MFKCVLFLVLLCLCAGPCPSSGDPIKCKREDDTPTCVCEHFDGVIDLTKIANFDGTPRFTGLRDIYGYVYEYNPCAPFTTKCDDVHACQYDENATKSYDIANCDEEMWIDDDGETYLYYRGTGERQVFVNLKCNTSATEPTITTKGDSESYKIYNFTLTSLHACPRDNPDNSTRCKAINGAPKCVCKHPDGIIDLTKIANFDGMPRFSGVSTGFDDYLYNYNPCAPFTEQGGNRANVHACQIHTAENISFAMAEYGSEEIRINPSHEVYIHYTGIGNREVVVFLVCEPKLREPLLTTTGDSKVALIYEFTLKSCHACPGGCSSNHDQEYRSQDVEDKKE